MTAPWIGDMSDEERARAFASAVFGDEFDQIDEESNGARCVALLTAAIADARRMERERWVNLASYMLCMAQDADTIEDFYDRIDPAHEMFHAAWWQRLARDKNTPHCGDCTNVPATCIRCLFEGWAEEAATIANSIEREAGE